MKTKILIYLLTALAISLMVLIGCAEKIVAPAGKGGVAISMKIAAVQEVSSMMVYVYIPEGDADRPIVDSLTLQDGNFVGAIDVLAGRNRRFVIEGLGYGRQEELIPMYRGEKTMDVLPGVENRLVVDLRPIIPMVKLVPHAVKIPPAGTFGLDLVVYNLLLLDSISVGVFYDLQAIAVDSVVKNPDLGRSIVELDERSATNNALTKVMVWNVSPLGTIVNAAGQSTLATIYLKSLTSIDTTPGVDTANFGVYPLALSQFAGDSIPINDVYYETAMILMDSSFGPTVPGKLMSRGE